MMEYKDLEFGKTYSCTYVDNNRYTFIHKNTANTINAICVQEKRFFTNGWQFYKESSDLRLATPDERYHLDLCIEADKFVPYTYDKIENYEIY